MVSCLIQMLFSTNLTGVSGAVTITDIVTLNLPTCRWYDYVNSKNMGLKARRS